MNQNPFATNTFASIWFKHFHKSKKPLDFSFIKHLKFAEHGKFSLYYNAGNKLTNGNFYKIDEKENDFNRKTFLIRDIPSYHDMEIIKSKGLKTKVIFQYEGFTTRIENYKSLDDYLRHIYKSNSRSKLRRNVNRLESCFDVEYKMYYGEISDDTYYSIFNNFYELFEKRYSDKGEPCGELEPKIWAYYTELGLVLIREKMASLFVIYCDKKPVGITFSYHIDDILIEALTVFDIDFYKFNIGHTMILKMLEWSFENNIKLFDYTQGDFEYKKRWSDSTYKTNYHVLYDSKSVKSILLANILNIYFNSKRKFRELKLNRIYHNFKHKLFGSRITNNVNKDRFIIQEAESIDVNSLIPINLNDESQNALKRALNEYLYKNPESFRNIKVLKLNDSIYYAQCKNKILKIIRDNE